MATTTEVLQARVSAAGVGTFRRSMQAAKRAVAGFKREIGEANRELNDLPASKSVRVNASGAESATQKINRVDRSAEKLPEIENIHISTTGGDETNSQLTRTTQRLAAMVTNGRRAQVAMAGIAAVSTAAVIPSLVMLLSTLAPLTVALGGVVVGLGAVAGVFAAIAGSAYVAYMTSSSEATQQLKNEIGALGPKLKEIIAPFGEQFIPLIRDAVAALPKLTQSVINALGPMEPFKQALRDAGAALMTVIPNLVEFAAKTARQALPAMRAFASYILENAGPALNIMRDAFRAALPAVVEFSKAFLRALAIVGPPLTKLGAVTLPLVADTMLTLAKAGRRGIDMFLAFNEATNGLAAKATMIAGAIGGLVLAIMKITNATIAVTVVKGLAGAIAGLSAPIAIAIGAIVLLAAAFATNFGGIRDDAMAVMTVLKNQLMPTFVGLKNLVKMVLKSLTPLWNTFKKDVEVAVGAIGDALKGVLIPAIRVMGKTIRKWVAKATVWWQQHGDKVVATVTKAYNLIKQGIKVAVGVIKNIVRGVVDSLTTIWNNGGKKWWNSIKKTFNSIVKTVRMMMANFIKIIKPVIARATKFWNQHKKDIKLIFNTLVTITKVVFETIGSVISRVMAFLGKLIRGVLKGIRMAWNLWGDEIIAVVTFVADALFSVLGVAIEGLATLIKVTTAAINGNWTRVWNLIVDFFKGVWKGIVSFAKKWGGRLLDYLKGVFGKIKTAIGNKWEEIKAGIRQRLAAIKQRIKAEWTKIKAQIDQKINEIKTTIVDTTNEIQDRVKEWIENTKQTITDGIDTVLENIRTFVEDTVTAFQNLVDRATEKAKNMKDNLIEKAKEMKTEAVSQAEQLVTDVIDELSNLPSKARQAGADAVQSLADGITSKIGAVKNAASNVASAIADRLPGSDAKTGPLSHLTDQSAALSTTVAKHVTANIRPVEKAGNAVAGAVMPQADIASSMPNGVASGGGTTNNISVDITIEGDADKDDVRDGTNEGLRDALRARDV